MPDIELPVPGVTANPDWAPMLNAAITAVNSEVDGRLGPDQLSATFVGAQPRVLDVRRFGVVADGVTDDTEAIRDACDAARALASAATPVVLEFPAGVMRVTGTLGARLDNGKIERTSYVSWIGQGGRNGATQFHPVGPGFSMLFRRAQAEPLRGITTKGFEIDGSNYEQPGAYNPEYGKGIFEQDHFDSVWDDLYIHDCLATGLGIDYLVNYVIQNVQADRNGRGYTGNFSGNIGASGIGIGTGRYDIENGVIQACFASDNINHGIFFERQGGGAKLSRGMKVIGCYTAGNRHNLADRGVDGAEFIACTSTGATGFGFFAESGKNLQIIGGDYFLNGEHGIAVHRLEGGALIDGANIHHNAMHGVYVWFQDVSGVVRDFVRVVRNNIYENQRAGVVEIQSATGARACLEVSDNVIENNGSSGTENDGIRILSSNEELRIHRNRVRDSRDVKTQNRGIVLVSGITLTAGEIADNDLRGNLGAGLAHSATPGATFAIARNHGYNDTLANIVPTVGASPWTYTAPAQPAQFSMYGGANSVSVKINGAVVAAGISSGTWRIKPGDTVELTYTTLPTVQVFRQTA